MSDGGKGSSPRPYSVPKDQFDKNWEQVFGKKDQQTDTQQKEKDATI
jgi:hypothetical protein